MFGEDEVIKSHRRRAHAIVNIILIAFTVVFARLWWLQVYKGKKLYEYSLKNRLRKEVVRAPRGMIFSRNNDIIVDNIPRFDAVLTPQFLQDRKKTISKLAKILDMEEEEIKKILVKKRGEASYKPILIKKNISRKEVAVIETENSKVPGVSVETFISREYAQGEIGAHLYGYISEISKEQLGKYIERDQFNYKSGDFIGKRGLEERLDLTLRGVNGHEFVEVDAMGRKKKHIITDNIFKGIKNLPAIPGKNVRLTIDMDLQRSAFEALEGKVGSAVAMDIETGEILAMVSRPSFNPNRFNRGMTDYWGSLVTHPWKPLRNRSIQDHYAPGSTFKAITLIAALEEGIVNARTNVKCTGKFKFGRRTYHCWKQWGHGNVDAVKALRESCDVYFYKIATDLDIDVLAKYSRAFGFGSRLGIDLPREESGLIPTKEWKLKRNGIPWQKGETLSCVIGQSYMLATPLQLAMAYGAIANGGKVHKPSLLKEVFSNSGEVEKRGSYEVKNEIKLRQSTLDIVRKGLYEVANHPKGTVWWRRGEGLEMSGKTGTSQVIRMSAEKLFAKCEDKPIKNRHHGLFVGYAPSDNPKIVASAVVEHGCSGGKAASPIVTSMLTTYMKKYMPDLQKKQAEAQVAKFSKWLKVRNAEKERKQKEKEELMRESSQNEVM